jgi:hypothetical protein
MTQDERWLARYNEVVMFIETNKRRPSKYAPEERNAWNWLRHTQKQYGSGELKAERVEMFRALMELCEQYRRKNQYE